MKLHDPTPGSVLEEPRYCVHLGDRTMAGVYQATIEFLKDELKKITKERFGNEPFAVYWNREKRGRRYTTTYVLHDPIHPGSYLIYGHGRNLVDAYRDMWNKIIEKQSEMAGKERMNS